MDCASGNQVPASKTSENRRSTQDDTDRLIGSSKKLKLNLPALFTTISNSRLANTLSTDEIINICTAAQEEPVLAVPQPTQHPTSYQLSKRDTRAVAVLATLGGVLECGLQCVVV